VPSLQLQTEDRRRSLPSRSREVFFRAVRSLLSILGLLLSHLTLIAQGYVVFANRVGAAGLDAPVLMSLEPRSGPGPGWTAQLFLKKDDSLAAIASSSFSHPGISEIPTIDSYWYPQLSAVPRVLPGQEATFVVRAWKTSFGSYESAASFGYSGESLPVTITVGDNSKPAPLIGLQPFYVGPFLATVPRLSLSSPYLPLSFAITNSSALFNTVDISSDLRVWEAYLGLSTRLGAVQVIDPSPGSIGERRGPSFFRLRVGVSAFPSLADWQRQGLTDYRFRFERICFCRHFSLSGMVEVREGRINAITDTRADGVPVAEVDLSEFKTIEELYAIIENDAARADLIVTAFAFHPSFWYPRVIDIDYTKGAADDEITYRASEFELLEAGSNLRRPAP
jgi:hypothetical protein